MRKSELIYFRTLCVVGVAITAKNLFKKIFNQVFFLKFVPWILALLGCYLFFRHDLRSCRFLASYGSTSQIFCCVSFLLAYKYRHLSVFFRIIQNQNNCSNKASVALSRFSMFLLCSSYFLFLSFFNYQNQAKRKEKRERERGTTIFRVRQTHLRASHDRQWDKLFISAPNPNI